MHEPDLQTAVVDAALLVRVFGRWPSFHDAEIVSMYFGRGAGKPYLDVTFHLFEMTNEIDTDGYFILKHHSLATIRFAEIVLYEMSGFNHQNVLFDLDVRSGGEAGRYDVSFIESFGCGARFACEEIVVRSVAPYSP